MHTVLELLTGSQTCTTEPQSEPQPSRQDTQAQESQARQHQAGDQTLSNSDESTDSEGTQVSFDNALSGAL